MSEATEKTLATWQVALASLGEPEALDRVRLVGERGIKARSLSVSASSKGVSLGAWLTGAREPLRPGIQQLVEGTLGVAHRWLIRWLLGRWPRGPMALHLPLDGAIEGIILGLIAPLSPTRVALSEGPLPFDAASVRHFKSLHAATKAPGLSGCRLTFSEHSVQSVGIRWGLTPSGLAEVMANHGLSTVYAEEVAPIVEGLTEGLSAAAPTFEAAYTPEPPERFAIEVGPVPTGRVLGLLGARWSLEAKERATEVARLITQRWTHRVRLEFGPEGLECTTALFTINDVNRADW